MTEQWQAFDRRSLLAQTVVPAERAGPGTVGLLSYEGDIWREFAGSAIAIAERPSGTLAVAAFPIGERVLVVPDPAGEGRFVAVWRVGDGDRLDTIVLDPRDFGPHPGVAAVLEAVAAQDEGVLRGEAAAQDCGNRKSDLLCADRSCDEGDCVSFSWFDQDYGGLLYGCVCAIS